MLGNVPAKCLELDLRDKEMLAALRWGAYYNGERITMLNVKCGKSRAEKTFIFIHFQMFPVVYLLMEC